MNAVEHIVTWIESSQPHYNRLLKLEQERKGEAAQRRHPYIAMLAFHIAEEAYREMVRGGDAYMGEHSSATILQAALALLEWELEQ